ncbi:MAG: hypothetical protein P4L40_18525 [Terracidiphilus sp.]|nr:hypothetical protein [Terracidiphilus sp.]
MHTARAAASSLPRSATLPLMSLQSPSGSKVKRFDGTAVATKLITAIKEKNQVSEWLTGSLDDDSAKDAAAQANAAAHENPPAPQPAPAYTVLGEGAKRGVGKEFSPRQQSYLDGIVVMLGKPLPGVRCSVVFLVVFVCMCIGQVNVWYFIVRVSCSGGVCA